MPLLNWRFGYCYSEWEMQEYVIKFLNKYQFEGEHLDEPRQKVIFDEITIPNIGRRSDIIIWITKRILVNIECKLSDYAGVLNQAQDHLRWADYSYICMPAETYIPPYRIGEMIKHGIGLLRYDNKTKTVQEPVFAVFNRKKDKIIRELVKKKLEKELS